MCSRERKASIGNADSMQHDESLRLALVISLLRSRIERRRSSSSSYSSSGAPAESDALRWKRKAKERKQEIIGLKEDLKEVEDASHCDLFPQIASCKCYFFDNLGKYGPRLIGEDSNQRFNDVLRRRFLRQVRLKERRKPVGSSKKPRFSESKYDDEAEHLRASVDFLVELCETDSWRSSNFRHWSHQAVDFILVSLKNLVSMGKNLESIEGIVSNLITRLIIRMCSPEKVNDSEQTDTDCQFYIQHLIRKLGRDSYIGQRAMFSVSQRVSILAESLLFMDPFHESFPEIHECIFTLIQLVEFLISDYLLSWSEDEAFETTLFEEWVTSVLHARKAAESLESRNGLYVLYMDRVVGGLAKRVSQASLLHNLKPDILDKLFS